MSPRRQERLFEKHYSKTLHNIAEGDFRTAQAIAGLTNIRIENVLKAALVAKEIPVPMIDDLAAEESSSF